MPLLWQGSTISRLSEQVDNCGVCGEAFGAIRADDAAPWLTIIIVGHLFLPLMLYFEAGTSIPAWVAACGWSALFIALSWRSCRAPRAFSSPFCGKPKPRKRLTVIPPAPGWAWGRRDAGAWRKRRD